MLVLNPLIEKMRKEFVSYFSHITLDEVKYDAQRGYMFYLDARTVSKSEVFMVLKTLHARYGLPELAEHGGFIKDLNKKILSGFTDVVDDLDHSLVVGYSISFNHLISPVYPKKR